MGDSASVCCCWIAVAWVSWNARGSITAWVDNADDFARYVASHWVPSSSVPLVIEQWKLPDEPSANCRPTSVVVALMRVPPVQRNANLDPRVELEGRDGQLARTLHARKIRMRRQRRNCSLHESSRRIQYLKARTVRYAVHGHRANTHPFTIDVCG